MHRILRPFLLITYQYHLLYDNLQELLGKEPVVQLPSGTITFKEYIAKEREIINPNFKPIFAAASHVTYSVMVSPPTTHHRDVVSMVSSPLSYVLPRKRPVPINILDDISFYLRPGEMTLLLGAPGGPFMNILCQTNSPLIVM